MQPTTKHLVDDDAPTPVRGTPIARIRRLSQRFSRRVGPLVRNRRAGWVVVFFCVLFAVALALFMMLADDPAEVPDNSPMQAP
jgi:hypothetical protein